MLAENTHNCEGGLAKPPDAPVVVAETKSKPSFGESLLAEIDPKGRILTEDQRREVLRIESADALKTMLYADLGNPLNPNIEACHRVFGELMNRTIEIPQILMTWQFFTITQCQLCIEDMTLLMRDKTLSGLERVNAGKARIEAVSALNRLLANARNLAKAAGVITKMRDRSKPVKSPKNDAPVFG